jgi:tetratricopeptide (TPR) repeat protein
MRTGQILLFAVLSFVFNNAVCSSKSPSAKQKADTLTIAQQWFKKGMEYDGEGNTEKGDSAVKEALRLATIIKDYTTMAKSLNFLAINLGAAGKKDEAIELSFKAFEYYILAGDSSRAANVKINIGMDYNNQGKYEEALKIELEALDLRLQCGDSTNLAAYYQRIGEVYKGLGIHEKWKSSLETARHLSKVPKYANFKTQIGILNDYGGILEAEKKYSEAVAIYLDMYKRSSQEKYLNGMATALTNLSPAYRNSGQNLKALECASEALTIQSERGNDYGRLTAFNQLGEAYLTLGQSSLAKENFNQGLQLSIQMEHINDQKESLNGLYRVAREEANWKEALHYHEKWSQLEDSLQNIDLQEKLTNLETKYQTGKKEQQIALLNIDNQLKKEELKYRKVQILSISLFGLLTLVLLYFLMRQRQLSTQNREIRLSQQLLRTQMNPHFIFNAIGSIQSYMYRNDGKNAAFFLSRFSGLMRAVLEQSNKELVSIREERETLENYLILERMRAGEEMEFEIKVDPELEEEELLMPPMLIQPFVENAIKHAFKNSEPVNRVTIDFLKLEETIRIEVRDNGTGYEPATQNSGHNSMAISIFRERMKFYEKKYRKNAGFKIVNLKAEGEQGTMVSFCVPLINE